MTRCIFVLAMLLGPYLFLQPAPIHAQENDPSLDNPAKTLEQESQLRNQEIDDSKCVLPSSDWQKSMRPDQVFLAFPQNDAYFLLGSVITLGWQPVLEPSLSITYYKITVASVGSALKSTDRTDVVDENTVSTYLFTPIQAGRYFWTVYAVTEDGKTIPSVGRYLNIIE